MHYKTEITQPNKESLIYTKKQHTLQKAITAGQTTNKQIKKRIEVLDLLLAELKRKKEETNIKQIIDFKSLETDLIDKITPKLGDRMSKISNLRDAIDIIRELRISDSSDIRQIRKSLKTIMTKLHPDKNHHNKNALFAYSSLSSLFMILKKYTKNQS